MTVEVKVPQLSESVSQANLVAWLKKVGDFVKRDDNLVDIETDKVVLEIPAPTSGQLVRILKEDGESVVSGDVIAVIDETAATGAKSAPLPAAQAPVVAPITAASVVAAASPEQGTSVMPAARKLAADAHIDVTTLTGSGRGGRVTKQDVMQAQGVSAPPAQSVSAPPAQVPAQVVSAVSSAVVGQQQRVERRVPMTRLRQRIAERLLHSQATNAILTTFNEVNMQAIMSLRKQYGEAFLKKHDVRLGFMAFFIKAAVSALRKYPIVNASVDGQDVLYHEYIDIGVAVGSPRGLVVPILRDADQMSMADIEKKINEFGEKAKTGRLALEELSGGTFSISNGGVFGSLFSTPIINPPQSAILGIHAIKERPVAENGQVVIRPMNYLALSYDHRIVDGREAVLSLVAMKEALEDPVRLIFDM